MNLDRVNLDLSTAKELGVASKEDLVDLLKTGELVVVDRRTGKFLTELFGIALPTPEKVLETVAQTRT